MDGITSGSCFSSVAAEGRIALVHEQLLDTQPLKRDVRSIGREYHIKGFGGGGARGSHVYDVYPEVPEGREE
jgi:hypothetical protein